MKKLCIVATTALFAACNSSNEPAKVDSMKSPSDSATTSATTPAMRDINSPYPVTYSSKFEAGDPKYAETILGLWKDWDNGNLANSKNAFADTVTLHFYDGTVIHGARDSVLAMAQTQRNTLASSVSRVDAVTAMKSTDKNQNWALVWGMETDTDKKGHVDSIELQETWGFDKNDKAEVVYQFKAATRPPKKK